MQLRKPHTSELADSSAAELSDAPASSPKLNGLKGDARDRAAEKKRRLARKHEFRSRTSPLDFETLEREQNPMRGFFVLFWTFMAFYVLVTAYQNWRRDGFIVSLRFYFIFSQDAWGLIKADAAMVGSMFFSVVFQKLFVWGLIPRAQVRIVQHTLQSIWFAACLFTVFWKSWPWIQSGFFVLHSIAMMFKMHSYNAYNIELFFKNLRLQKLRKLVAAHKKDDDAPRSPTSPVTPSSPTLTGFDDPQSPDAIRAEITLLERELVKPSHAYPNNITFFNFIDYLLVPTLVYELEYPRTKDFRPLYFLQKAAATFATFGLLYISYEHYIHPVLLDMSNLGFFDSFMQLLMPFMMCYLLIFFIIFECICNAFAELTFFADREFYDDWWNSVTFDEFARKWNKPVHEFLLRHVYLESITSYKLSKNDATLLTFFLSSCVHELVMVIIGKRLRFYLFFMQMFQIPLIYISRLPFFRGRKTAGNAFFWFGMFMGPPLLAVVYMREHYA
ncbi:Sterol O-acyltransferase 2 (Sterol-ester synthase 2) [Polyrhizophydium stewartii]|uniref:O-acyltransferase n=1 Tax=Polyrhizophydium stewartii TaxID=2732419 RepID=A0ABR4NKS7_9FUNG